jgi:ubiquinone/menaquinone biosynthesis C-methylase UbiE
MGIYAIMLSRAQVKAFYDRFGEKQDRQAFYEDPALRDLLTHAVFEQASNVFELGCGTGRFAELLLDHHLQPDATYRGTDLSPTMIQLAEKRLGRFGSRVQVVLTDGCLEAAADPASVDAFVANYVLDLLPLEDIRTVIAEARRVLKPGGRLCVVGLTNGIAGLSRIVSGLWSLVHSIRPTLVGGCRPLNLLGMLNDGKWHVHHANVVVACGIPSEIVIASPEGSRT